MANSEQLKAQYEALARKLEESERKLRDTQALQASLGPSATSGTPKQGQ